MLEPLPVHCASCHHLQACLPRTSSWPFVLTSQCLRPLLDSVPLLHPAAPPGPAHPVLGCAVSMLPCLRVDPRARSSPYAGLAAPEHVHGGMLFGGDTLAHSCSKHLANPGTESANTSEGCPSAVEWRCGSGYNMLVGHPVKGRTWWLCLHLLVERGPQDLEGLASLSKYPPA